MNQSTAKLLLLPLIVWAALYSIRNYTGEVTTLYTIDGAGASHTTRIWVVEHGPELWIRSIDPTSDWLDHVVNHPQVELKRAGSIASYHATPYADRRTRINALMAQRYGWADWILSKIEDRDQAVPIFLDPLG